MQPAIELATFPESKDHPVLLARHWLRFPAITLILVNSNVNVVT